MKQKYMKRFFSCSLIIGLMITWSCNDEWEKHYNVSNEDLPDKTLKQAIEEDAELTTFYKMLEITGFSSNLDASQSYTVWAPTNNALQNIDTTDKDQVQKIVLNHITRSRLTTSNEAIRSIKMLNGKYVNFANEGGSYRFDDVAVKETNIVTKNGFIHKLDGYVPYKFNIWEYIGQVEFIDSVRNYLYSQDIKEFDPENSTEIGTDSLGQVVYDSAFINKNEVLSKIGALDSEDSSYTVIIPNNFAWSEAYNRIHKYFNFADDAALNNRQDKLTKWTLVQDMAFRGTISQPSNYDSLTSSIGNVFYQPENLFANTQKEELSNGLFYVTGQMPFADTASWFKEIKVEAENVNGRTNSNSQIFNRTSYGSGLDVSGNEYILVDPTSSGSAVEFSIPNTLSAKYNIYCVFVPAYIVDESNTTPSKATFTLTYIRRQSGSTFIEKITPDNNETNPYFLTKMLVDQYDFEYANVVDDDYDKVRVKLEVESDVTIEEELNGSYTRTMRIDCIILEPVIE